MENFTPGLILIHQPTVDTSLQCLHYDKENDQGYPVENWARFLKGERPFPEAEAVPA